MKNVKSRLITAVCGVFVLTMIRELLLQRDEGGSDKDRSHA